MKRRKGSGRFLPQAEGQDINPMDGVANLSDVMLVFACGLMLAIITFWNVDVAGIQARAEPEMPPMELTETAEELTGRESESVDGDGLVEYGTVYRDPETGKLYILSGEE